LSTPKRVAGMRRAAVKEPSARSMARGERERGELKSLVLGHLEQIAEEEALGENVNRNRAYAYGLGAYGEGAYDEDGDDADADRWDCETIVSTYSNTENRPAVLEDAGDEGWAKADRRRKARAASAAAGALRDRAAAPKAGQRIFLSKAGVPIGVLNGDKRKEGDTDEADGDSDGEAMESDDEDRPGAPVGPRPRGETAEEKRARKAAVKEHRALRRKEKKTNKKVFVAEETKMRQVAVASRVDNAQAIRLHI